MDKQLTIGFYEELGFKLSADYGDYILMNQKEVELHFFAYPELHPNKSDFMIYLRMETGIETFYAKIQDFGITIHPNGKLESKSWNQKEFSIIDPNGTLLTFGQSVK
ncbi:VOC family protein [Flavobacterium sp.]